MGQRRFRDASRTVYSTGKGRICPNCGQPVAGCRCRAAPRAPRGDGVVRVRREVKGRGGKTVTTISGVPLPRDELKQLAAELKRLCGSGGSLKEGVIEIQGDHGDTLLAELRARGYTTKRSGG
jgi:translation initiation factor 1